MDKVKKLQTLRQQKKSLVDQSSEILNAEQPTAEQLQAVKDLQEKVAALNTQIELVEAQIELERGQEAVQEVAADEAAAGNAQAKKPVFACLGQQLQAIGKAAQTGVIDPRLSEVNSTASGGAANVPSDGGYFIQGDIASEIIKNVYETGQLAAMAKQIEIGANSNKLTINTIDETSRATGSRMGGVQIYRTAEADTVTASKPKFGKIELELEKLMGLAYVTDELLEDAVAMDSIYKDAFTQEFGFVLDNEIVNGTGAGQCLGILNSGALVSVAKETGQDAATLVKENIDKMWSRLHAASRANAVWLINQEVEPQLDNLQMVIGTGGVPVYLPPGGLSDTPYARLKGRQVIPIEQASALGTVGDIMLVDMSKYLLIKKGGLKTDMSVHVRFINGEMTFRFTMRNNGQPTWRLPLTPFKGSATLSPFVALAARA